MNHLVLYQLVGLMLLVIGLVGVVWRRSLVGILICVELMLNGAGLSIVSVTQLTGVSPAYGQVAALLIMGLAAAEATLVLAIVLIVAKRFGRAEADALTTLKG